MPDVEFNPYEPDLNYKVTNHAGKTDRLTSGYKKIKEEPAKPIPVPKMPTIHWLWWVYGKLHEYANKIDVKLIPLMKKAKLPGWSIILVQGIGYGMKWNAKRIHLDLK